MRRIVIKLILVLELLMLAVAGTLSVYAAEDSWVTKAPMDEARSGLGVAVVNGKIYAIGGSVAMASVLPTKNMIQQLTLGFLRR